MNNLETYLELSRRADCQHPVADHVLAGVAAALRAVDGDHVGAQTLRRQRVAHGGALVDHDDAVLLQGLDQLLRTATCAAENHTGVQVQTRLLWQLWGTDTASHTCSLHDAHSLLDDDADVRTVVWRNQRGQQGQVDAEGLAGELAALPIRCGSVICACVRWIIRSTGISAR